MNKKKSKDINDQVEYGLDSIDPERKIEISLKDFMLIYKTFDEFNRFFHQRLHYPTIEDIVVYLGNRDKGASSLIHKIYYKVLSTYLPKDIEDCIEGESDPFHHPEYPYYYKVKNDENIDDGTLNVKDKKSFIDFVRKLLEEYTVEGKNWENNKIESFLEGLIAYAEDIDGYYKNSKFDTSAKTPTWRIFAQILQGATGYE